MEVSMNPWEQAMLAIAEAITHAARRRRLDDVRRWLDAAEQLTRIAPVDVRPLVVVGIDPQ